MAYGAVCCLDLIIERLLKSPHVSIVQNSSPHILKHLYNEILSFKFEALQEFNTRRSTINMKMVKSLELEIIEAVYQFEDVIEPHLSNQFYSQTGKDSREVDMEGIKQDVDSFIEMMNKMKRTYIHELHNPSPEEEEEEDKVVQSRIDVSNMFGLSDLFDLLKDRLTSSQPVRKVVSLSGTAGIGKTTLANKLFLDPSIGSHFSKHLFVTIGPKYLLADILLDILTQVNADHLNEVMLMKGEKLLAELKRMVFESLNYLRYLIVFDDIWDIELCFELLDLFPYNNNGSQILLTTRIDEVAECAQPVIAFKISFLSKKDSWDLFRDKVFGEQVSFPYELAKAGKKIAENCEGLPLTIVTVAEILSKADKTIEYWNEVAENEQHSVYKDAYDQMSKVLYPSYDYLDQHLKACFLYIAAFPQHDSIHVFRLMQLWGAEGFCQPNQIHYSDEIVASTYDSSYLIDLYPKNVLMNNDDDRGNRLHSSFWYLCNKEAAKNRFFYAFNDHIVTLSEESNIKCQRRLSIRNSVLLAMEDVHNSIASASTIRSLLCIGPYHHYQVPLCMEHLRLLRVLHALSFRFYEFPMEVVKLVQLRYFAFTCNGNLPPSISKLLSLQYLIVERHSIIKSNGILSYLPIEIWNMKELKCLEAIGRDLPHPPEGFFLPNLIQLTGIGPQSCTKDVFEKIPNLSALAIAIYQTPDATEPLNCFEHISHLHELEILNCIIVNPILKTEVGGTPLVSLSHFPSRLTALILNGLGYPWAEISKISSLPNLKKLTLQCYAFRGPKWEVHDYEFQSLLHLEIADTDLVQWKFVTTSSCLPTISFLLIAHCYKLKEIPLAFGTSLRRIKAVDCNRIGVACLLKLKEELDDKYGDYNPLTVNVHYSV